MLDLHCHILPGVDDGAATVADALDMARCFVRDGVTHVTATPHHHRFTRMPRAEVLPRVVRLNAALAAANVPLTILPGAENQLTDTATYRREFEAGTLCHLGDGPAFTLMEMSWNARQYQKDAPELVAWLRARGMTPIVAHPERHDFFRDDPAKLRALADAGAWVQFTVDSLLGNFGRDPRDAAEEMLAEYPRAVLATDSHNVCERCSGLSPGYAWVRKRLGEARERELRANADEVLNRLLERPAATG